MVTDNTSFSFLLKQLQAGSTVAFDELYQCFSKDLLRNILYQVKDIETAKDITQEVFLFLWKQRERLDPERPLKHYLNGIAKNLVIDSYRKIAGSRKLTEKLIREQTELYLHSDVVVEYKETVEAVAKAIDTLPNQQQTVYRKCRLEGKSHEEVAYELGISKATVNNHIVKANRRVTDYLRKYDQHALIWFLWVITKH